MRQKWVKKVFFQKSSCGVVHWDLMEKGTLLHPNL